MNILIVKQEVVMKSIREPLVAGTFYPDNENELSIMLENQALKVTNNFKNSNILGIISPHAGYIYSLKTAMEGYSILKNKKFKHVIIISPSHHYNNFKFSVGNYSFYKTPLGLVKVNSEFVSSLLEYQEVIFNPNAHLGEHAIEVQLPILQYYFPHVDIVPIIFGEQNLSNGNRLAEILLEVFKDCWDDIVVIISSDLSHYHNFEIAKQMDHLLINSLSNFDSNDLNEIIKNRVAEACGIGGIFTLIELAKKLHFDKFRNLRYSSSGETYGDYKKVVGYLSSVVYR